ncbi:MAG: hypothetical protein IKN79_10410 [Eubacterium sp.]|nr:hypothetical protein [Eubacterium sp.]
MAENINSEDRSHPYDIYDRMFKRLLTLSAKAIVRFINGIFGTDYPENSRLTYNWTEFEDEKLRKVLADTIITINDQDAFHIEAEMKNETIVLRVLEYGFLHTLRTMREFENPDTGETDYRITFPQQAVIYLDSARRIPDQVRVLIDFGKEGMFEHYITVIRFQEQTPREIREKSMVILLPFKLLSLRSLLAEKREPEDIQKLLDLYKNDIMNTISQAYQAGEIKGSDETALMSFTRMLMDHLYRKYDEIREGVEEMRDRDHSLELDMDEYIDKMIEMEEQLDSKAEELASMNRELASMNKELASMNEELASKDEELASKDEELASKAEELASKDEELASKAEELASKDELIRLLSERLAQYEPQM